MMRKGASRTRRYQGTRCRTHKFNMPNPRTVMRMRRLKEPSAMCGTPKTGVDGSARHETETTTSVPVGARHAVRPAQAVPTIAAVPPDSVLAAEAAVARRGSAGVAGGVAAQVSGRSVCGVGSAEQLRRTHRASGAQSNNQQEGDGHGRYLRKNTNPRSRQCERYPRRGD